MFDSIFDAATSGIADNLVMAGGASFLWGLCSVLLSPCHLAAIPVMAAHAAGYGAAAVGHALRSALCFAVGYFGAISALGIVCALLGRAMNFTGHFWTIPIGFLLFWFGYALLRQHSCIAVSAVLGRVVARLGLGLSWGAVVLGLGYGVLSSGCTLGFLAPVLAVALPQGVAASVVLAVCFGLGHCVPMALVGGIEPLTRRFMHTCEVGEFDANGSTPHGHGEHGHDYAHARHHLAEIRFRRVVGVLVCLAGVLFVLHPFLE